MMGLETFPGSAFHRAFYRKAGFRPSCSGTGLPGLVLTAEDGIAPLHLESTLQAPEAGFMPFLAAATRTSFDCLLGAAEQLSYQQARHHCSPGPPAPAGARWMRSPGADTRPTGS